MVKLEDQMALSRAKQSSPNNRSIPPASRAFHSRKISRHLLAPGSRDRRKRIKVTAENLPVSWMNVFLSSHHGSSTNWNHSEKVAGRNFVFSGVGLELCLFLAMALLFNPRHSHNESHLFGFRHRIVTKTRKIEIANGDRISIASSV